MAFDLDSWYHQELLPRFKFKKNKDQSLSMYKNIKNYSKQQFKDRNYTITKNANIK